MHNVWSERKLHRRRLRFRCGSPANYHSVSQLFRWPRRADGDLVWSGLVAGGYYGFPSDATRCARRQARGPPSRRTLDDNDDDDDEEEEEEEEEETMTTNDDDNINGM